MQQFDKSLPQVYTDDWNAQDLCGFFPPHQIVSTYTQKSSFCVCVFISPGYSCSITKLDSVEYCMVVSYMWSGYSYKAKNFCG